MAGAAVVPRGKVSHTTERGLARAEAILAAAHAVFVTDGYGGFSMRSVAARVGVSLSTIQHYYPSKELLVEAMLLESAARYQRAIDAIVQNMPKASRTDQFMAAMEMFLAEMKRPAVADGLVQMWAAARVDAHAAQTVARIQKRERKTVRSLIAGIRPNASERDCEARAALIVAQIEGLVLQHAGLRGLPAVQAAAIDEAARASFRWLATHR
ncbi:TetR/AcrR family transcriptional regulator [Rivibacter subsaxonicus]|uniref:TetR family transcriptional regulator n=1 Tax=Rivibacter subsaxonicus TaxID=457575 RepID=A0A4V2FS07_9BURK|nr:TetR/AcrR family transcriptional regulator [Rivibacter subsaxonicus]RZT91969.1 TetR family transcriptional regulator [Rivibacter subsaxonicus]